MFDCHRQSGAVAAEEALLRKFVHSPFKLGRVAVKLPHLGLGTQYINTLDINGDEHDTGTVPIVWAHGAGAGLGFGYRNFDAFAVRAGARVHSSFGAALNPVPLMRACTAARWAHTARPRLRLAWTSRLFAPEFPLRRPAYTCMGSLQG